jgi:hypothetical protein
MLRPRRQRRLLRTAGTFSALVGAAFVGSYAGMRASEYVHAQPAKHGSQNIDYLSALWLWITHDATGFFTIILCFITGTLAVATYLLYVTTRDIARDSNKASVKALEASTEHTATLFNIERAYLVGGGQVAVAGKTFQIEFSNYGKTPAFIYAFGVEFAATLEEVQAGPQEVFPMFLYEDVVPPGGGTTPQKATPVPITVPKATVAYGAFWYEDWQKRVHIYRFILRIVPGVSGYGSTLTSVPGVDRSYMYRD